MQRKKRKEKKEKEIAQGSSVRYNGHRLVSYMGQDENLPQPGIDGLNTGERPEARTVDFIVLMNPKPSVLALRYLFYSLLYLMIQAKTILFVRNL